MFSMQLLLTFVTLQNRRSEPNHHLRVPSDFPSFFEPHFPENPE